MNRPDAKLLLQNAIEQWPQFDTDDDVNGADLVEWFAEFRKLAKQCLKPPPPAKCRHTCCRHCGLDIEGLAPYRRGEWRDRGNNTSCPSGKVHAPVMPL